MMKGGLLEAVGSEGWEEMGNRILGERLARSKAPGWGHTCVSDMCFSQGPAGPGGRGEGIGLVLEAAGSCWRASGPRTRACAFQPLDSALCGGGLEPEVSAG